MGWTLSHPPRWHLAGFRRAAHRSRGAFYFASCAFAGRVVILHKRGFVMVDVEVAAWALVHEYQGGAVALGARCGIDSTLLSNKVNPNNDRNHLMLKEAVRIQVASGDHRILHAMADNLGELCIPLPTVQDGDEMQATLRSMRAFGAMMGETEDALDDGRMTPNELNELKRIQGAMLETIAHVSALYSMLQAKAGR
jgi:hypothetical protein